jgi:hypothetical protein
MTRSLRVTALAVMLMLANSRMPVRAAQDDLGIRAVVGRLEQLLRDGDAEGYLTLLVDGADRARAREFALQEFRPGATRIVLKERSLAPVAEAPPDTAYRLSMDAFADFDGRARVMSWRVEVRRRADGSWGILNQARISSIDDVYRLTVNSSKQLVARDFAVRAEDLDLTLADGSIFTVDTDKGTTGLILLGRGTMRFHPAPAVEKGQLRVTTGSDTLETPFEAAFVRVGSIAGHADLGPLTARPPDPRDLRRAEDVFREESAKTFSIALGDLAPGNWSSLPGVSDVVAEIRTKRYGTLTYSKSDEAEEDISLFDRAKGKNISVYSSIERLATRGPFRNEDDAVDYDVLDNEVDISFAPDRRWFDARARLHFRITAALTNQIALRLSDTLSVESVTSDDFGSLFSVRVRDQNTLLVNLPVPMRRDAETTITIVYSGRVGGASIEWETLPFTQRELDSLQQTNNPALPLSLRPEPIYLYGTRTYWYPRTPVFDFATATMRIWVPPDYDCIASGELSPESPTLDDVDPARRRKLYVFTALRPIRNLSFLVTRLVPVERATVALNDEADPSLPFKAPAMGGAVYNTLDLTVLAHQRLVGKARGLVNDTVNIAQFFRSIIGDTPYSSLTLALVEGNAAGGHSPGYIATIRRRSDVAPSPFRNDPASVDDYPEFATAHQIAHQWWGQAVGWKTYHDQWLSESFAQYFAALYVQHLRGDEAFRTVMRQMRRWGMEDSDQGPLSLGYRLGHVKDDGRVFRALVYNKGASVLDMLRRQIGDEAFFLGVRRFYASWRFQKAGADDLRFAFESEADRSLERFFAQWIDGTSLPRLKVSSRIESSGESREAVVRIEQTGEVFDVPVTLLLQYADRPAAEVVVPVSEASSETRIPLAGSLRRVDVRDEFTLGEIHKN